MKAFRHSLSCILHLIVLNKRMRYLPTQIVTQNDNTQPIEFERAILKTHGGLVHVKQI